MIGVAINLSCASLADAIDAWTSEGFLLNTIFPADSPRRAVLSSGDLELTLTTPPDTADRSADTSPARDEALPEVVCTRNTEGDWGVGRAEMLYRDLVADRRNGALIASHIKIPNGGPVPDQVHFHEVGFQIIQCLTGWVRVVYEDQGEPFVMHPGDLVLQAPTIRHRVLESSDGLEVLEVSSPAEHPTRFDHHLSLPTPTVVADRTFGGQRFVRHQADQASWVRHPESGWEVSTSAVGAASQGASSVFRVRSAGSATPHAMTPGAGHTTLLFALAGGARLATGSTNSGCDVAPIQLATGDAATFAPQVSATLADATTDFDAVVVTVDLAATAPGTPT